MVDLDKCALLQMTYVNIALFLLISFFLCITRAVTRGGGGVLSPFDGGGVRPEKKYRGVRELLFIPKKGGVRELE